MPEKRTNAQWLSDLRSTGRSQQAALQDLRAAVVSALPYALAGWLSPSEEGFDSLIEETAQETLLRVLDKLDTFEGRSNFTTWVYKIAVRIALSELRRKRWRDVSLEGLLEDEERPAPPGLMAGAAINPEQAAEQADMLRRVRRIIEEELTQKQRHVLVAARVQGIPVDEVARNMGVKRNALYKLMHDARLKLKRRLAREGLSPDDILAAFEEQ
jgi:RNA polymerase sigma-70 factor (ECF subfamily)